MPSFGLFFIFDLVSLTFHQHAKFEVCIFSRSRDIRGVPKFEKVGHVT